MTYEPATPPDGDLAVPFATVEVATTSHIVRAGETLTLGRSSACDVRFAHSPLDLCVARHALTIEGRTDGLLVHNESRTRSLRLTTLDGSEFEVAPLMVVGTSPFRKMRVHIPGAHGTRYVIMLTMSGLLTTTA